MMERFQEKGNIPNTACRNSVESNYILYQFFIGAGCIRDVVVLEVNWKRIASLQWFGYLERMKENNWSSKYRTFKVSGSFQKDDLRKHCMG